jgi:probable rRNA maturation factor
MRITINNEQRRIRLDEKKIESTTKRILKTLKLPPNASLSITFLRPSDIKRLNIEYFKKYRPTDVIALGYAQGSSIKNYNFYSRSNKKQGCYKEYLGDVLICPSLALKNAKFYNKDFCSELTLYIIHGILHLLGYEDTTRRLARTMQQKEKGVFEIICDHAS